MRFAYVSGGGKGTQRKNKKLETGFVYELEQGVSTIATLIPSGYH